MLGSASVPPPWGADGAGSISTGAHAGREFLGIRYALTCWLDELLIRGGLEGMGREQTRSRPLPHEHSLQEFLGSGATRGGRAIGR